MFSWPAGTCTTLCLVLLLVSIHWRPFLCHITCKHLGFAYRVLLRPLGAHRVGHFIPERLTPSCRWPTMPMSLHWLDLHLHFPSCLWEKLLLHIHKVPSMFLQNFRETPCGCLICIKNLKIILRHSLAGQSWLPWMPRWLARIPSLSLVLF